MKKPYFAIETTSRSFLIKKVASGTLVLPVDRVAYPTLEDAQTASQLLGIEISKIGTTWQII